MCQRAAAYSTAFGVNEPLGSVTGDKVDNSMMVPQSPNYRAVLAVM